MRIETKYSSKIANMTFLVVFLSLFINPSEGQTFQIHNGDTINVVDANNMKQGHWIYFGNMKPNIPDYSPESKIEEGEFSNNRKDGMWIKYYPDGKIHSEITFSNNRPKGHYRTYYPNGIVEEEGTWDNNRNKGDFERHYENGALQQKFNFNETGKRDGQQLYYYDNGNLMIDVTMNGGKETGEMTEYYANGDVKSKKYFNDGMIDAAKTQKFEPVSEIKPTAPKEDPNAKQSEKIKEDEVIELDKKVVTHQGGSTGASAHFVGTGDHTLYNKNHQISQKGYFKDYRLWNGSWYRYDENGILTNIEIYKNGKYVGDGVIEE